MEPDTGPERSIDDPTHPAASREAGGPGTETTSTAIGRDYRYSDESREALFGAISRMADEYRFGRTELSAEDLYDLAGAWSYLNGGFSAREIAFDAELDRARGRRGDRRPNRPPRDAG